jgi:hypothetical protein
MKKKKSKKKKFEYPKPAKPAPRLILTREEVLERIRTFPERREQFLAAARTGKG